MNQAQLLRRKIEALLEPLGLTLEDLIIKPEEGDNIVQIRAKVSAKGVKSDPEKELDVSFEEIVKRIKE